MQLVVSGARHHHQHRYSRPRSLANWVIGRKTAGYSWGGACGGWRRESRLATLFGLRALLSSTRRPDACLLWNLHRSGAAREERGGKTILTRNNVLIASLETPSIHRFPPTSSNAHSPSTFPSHSHRQLRPHVDFDFEYLFMAMATTALPTTLQLRSIRRPRPLSRHQLLTTPRFPPPFLAQACSPPSGNLDFRFPRPVKHDARWWEMVICESEGEVLYCLYSVQNWKLHMLIPHARRGMGDGKLIFSMTSLGAPRGMMNLPVEADPTQLAGETPAHG